MKVGDLLWVDPDLSYLPLYTYRRDGAKMELINHVRNSSAVIVVELSNKTLFRYVRVLTEKGIFWAIKDDLVLLTQTA